MSVEQLALVLNHSTARGTDKVVLLGIANHDGDGGAWPAVETLARYANVARSTVQEAIARLILSGELVRHLQDGGNHKTKPGWRPNRYTIVVACPPGCDRTTSHRVTPLPEAPADLWISGAPSTGPQADGARPTGQGGARPTGPKPSTKPTIDQGPASVTGPRTRSESHELPLCDVCQQAGDECMRRAAVSGHDYSPAKIDQHHRIARIRDEYGA